MTRRPHIEIVYRQGGGDSGPIGIERVVVDGEEWPMLAAGVEFKAGEVAIVTLKVAPASLKITNLRGLP